MYVADFRYDEGVRIRDEFVCPTLCSSNDFRTLSTSIYVIEVFDDKSKKCNE